MVVYSGEVESGSREEKHFAVSRENRTFRLPPENKDRAEIPRDLLRRRRQ
jgi:hypothetical protein